MIPSLSFFSGKKNGVNNRVLGELIKVCRNACLILGGQQCLPISVTTTFFFTTAFLYIYLFICSAKDRVKDLGYSEQVFFY